jgi:hypothetical protein
VTVDEARKDVSKISLRVDAVELAGLCRGPNYADRIRYPQDFQ